MLIFPNLERGQHRLQAAAPPRRRHGDRPDPGRHAPARARAGARRRRAGHRQHGRGGGGGRAGTQPVRGAGDRRAHERGADNLLETLSAVAPRAATSSPEGIQRWRHRRSRRTTPGCRAPRRPGSHARRATVHWNLVAPELIQHADPPRRRRARRHGPVRRRDVAAHRPLAERQVRREGAGSARRDVDWGKVNQPITPRALRHAARRRAAVSRRQRRAVRAGPLLRRRSGVPPRPCATCRRTRGTWRSCATCSSARERRELADVRAELHRAARAGVPGGSRAARHAHRHVHRARTSPSARSSSAARATPAS